jgi:plastocyanin
MKKALIIIVIIVVLGIGAFVLFKKPTNKNNNQTANNSTSNTSSNSSNSSSTAAAATITYSDSGYSPATITVKSGDTVAIKNTSSHEVQFDSDPHPVHTDDTDLNAGLVEPGQTKTFTVTQKGTFGYHNHLDPSQTGTIVIQ